LKFETKIIEIIPRTPNVKSFRFDRPSYFEYKAGQFMFVTIPTKYGELKKHFTISSSPTEKKFIEFTKRLTGSNYSNALNSLHLDVKVKINAPYGNFIFNSKIKKMTMLSGGIGITPLRSMCKYATDLNLGTSIILIYGNNTVGDITFKKEFDELQKLNENLKVIHTLTNPSSGWKGYTGYIDSLMIKKEIPDFKSRIFYVCGSPVMVEAIKKTLKEFNIPNKQIKTENFPGY
jgi:ferredoxin-NADP reductase